MLGEANTAFLIGLFGGIALGLLDVFVPSAPSKTCSTEAMIAA